MAPACVEGLVEAAPGERRPGHAMLVVTRHCPLEMRARSGWSIDQFAIAKKLGGGYASTVHLAICRTTGIQVAVKVYHRVKLSQLNHYQVRREIRIHAALDHPNILRLYAAFEDESGVYLVTEYASRGDVFGELDRRGGTMTEGDAVRQVLAPFMSALRYLHTLNVIHRDIKPENLLISASGDLKVGDFGLSIDTTRERPVTRVGTLDYMAPEVVVCPDKAIAAPPVGSSSQGTDSSSGSAARGVRGGGGATSSARQQHHYTHLVDAWAVGVLAYELTVGRAPFDAGNKRATIDQILNGQPTYPSWLSEQARHFISWSLTKDARARPDVPQLAYHPWITGHSARPPRPRLSGLRAAASVADLQLLPGAAGAGHAHMEARHKALVAGHVGAPSGLLGSSDGEESSECGEDSAAGPVAATGSASSCAASSSSSMAAGGSPLYASSTAARSGPASPEVLRAYVTRCASANNLEALRAAVLAQPPEPSNACFEPGGRFYNSRVTAPPPPIRTPSPAAVTPAGSAGSSSGGSSGVNAIEGPAPPAPHAPTITVTVKLPQSVATSSGTMPEAAGSNGTATSSSSSSSSSPRPVRTPPPPPRPPTLQIARTYSGGTVPEAAAAAATAAAAEAAIAQTPSAAAAPCFTPAVKPAPAPPVSSPATLCGGPPPTPDPGAPPRVQLFATANKGMPAAALAAVCTTAALPPVRAPRGGSGDSLSSEVAPHPLGPESSVSDGTCSRRGSGSGAGDRASASSGSAASTVATGGSGGCSTAAGNDGASLSPPEPVSPPHHIVGERTTHQQTAVAATALGVLSRLTGGSSASGASASTVSDGGSSSAANNGSGWWPTLPPCVNFLRPARSQGLER